MTTEILEFTGKYRFLSNFFSCPITVFGHTFKNAEAAFQSQKCKNPHDAVLFVDLDASESKRMGRSVSLREDWEQIKDDIMYRVLVAKFNQNLDLRAWLLATVNAYLVEGNNWGDRYWGKVDGVGTNVLGMLLMHLRGEIKHSLVV